MKTFNQAAISYARQGFAIFPCHPNGKRPMTLHGFKDATCDEKQISRWWKQWPDANIGLALNGKFWVLDVDNPDGEQSLARLEAQHEQLPLTTAVRTGSGGRHIYFQAPSFIVKTSAGKLGPGIDVRGANGYVLVPPSYTVAEYTWISRDRLTQAPKWLLALVGGQHRPAQGLGRPQGHKGHTAPLSRAYARSVLNGELSYLRQAVPGETQLPSESSRFQIGSTDCYRLVGQRKGRNKID